ncbi:hypothetical protein [Clostridium sp.]|uniref:hypothetical protein n=1 Tax=Clostridium sp. TaxID=1506 RepID=UPI001B76FB60|nr:hypothetical protein [Clostridium sp.]MBP3917307.1 hypothetical protein [Clostridium sp.]
MAYDNIIGLNNSDNIIPIEKISIKFDEGEYQELSLIKEEIIFNSLSVSYKSYTVSFKMGNTTGYREDNYSANVGIIVETY